MAVVQRLSAEVIDRIPGAWCDVCALPSAFVVHLALLADGAPFRLGHGVYCPDCATVRDTRPDDPGVTP